MSTPLPAKKQTGRLCCARSECAAVPLLQLEGVSSSFDNQRLLAIHQVGGGAYRMRTRSENSRRRASATGVVGPSRRGGAPPEYLKAHYESPEMLVPGGTVKISRREVKSLLMAGPMLVMSNSAVRRLVERVRRKAFEFAFA